MPKKNSAIGSGAVTRQTGAATRVKGSGAKVTPPLAKGGTSGKPWVSTPKRVVDRTASGKVEKGGGKQMRS